MKFIMLFTVICGLIVMPLYAQVKKSYKQGETVEVRVIPHVNRFKEDNHWVSILAASNGKVYFALTSHGGSAGLYEYEPLTDSVHHVAQMDDATRQYTPHLEPHSKIHAQIREDNNGNIWFGSDMGTHFYCQKWDVPDGYPGGHLFIYNPDRKCLKDLGVPFPRGSIRVLEMDRERGKLYIVTFPDGRFYTYDMNTGKSSFKGRVNNNDAVARAMVIDEEGNIYGSYNPYGIFKYSPEQDRLTDLPVTIPHLPPWCDKGHYRREHVWRKACWHPDEKVFYGLDEGSAILFRFDPANNEMEDLGRLSISELYDARFVPSTSYAFCWHPGLEKFIYAAPRSSWGNGYNARHLVTFDTETGIKTDHGPMHDPKNNAFPIYTEGMSVGPDGTIYLCGMVSVPGSDPEEEDVAGLVIINPSVIK